MATWQNIVYLAEPETGSWTHTMPSVLQLNNSFGDKTENHHRRIPQWDHSSKKYIFLGTDLSSFAICVMMQRFASTWCVFSFECGKSG